MNLLDVLKQEGHSGLLEGTCRIICPKEYSSAKEFFEDDSAPNEEVTVTFSLGIKPLGTFIFESNGVNRQEVDGTLKFNNGTKDEVLVTIFIDVDVVLHFCTFKAVYYKK